MTFSDRREKLQAEVAAERARKAARKSAKRPPKPKPRPCPVEVKREMRRLRDQGLKLREIGERFGVTRQRVSQVLGRVGSRPRAPKFRATKAELEELYSTLSIRELAEEIGCSRSWAYKLLERHGVKLRSKSEAAVLRREEGRTGGDVGSHPALQDLLEEVGG